MLKTQYATHPDEFMNYNIAHPPFFCLKYGGREHFYIKKFGGHVHILSKMFFYISSFSQKSALMLNNTPYKVTVQE